MTAAFVNGTRKFFAMASAPTGWTRDTTTATDHAIVITGYGGLGGTTGGTTNFTTVHPTNTISVSASASWFGNRTTDTVIDIPSHAHSGTVNARGTSAFGTTQQGYTFPASFYPSSPTAPRRPTYYPHVSAAYSPNFDQSDWSDAWPSTLVNMGSLVPGTTYAIAALGTTTQAQWDTVTGQTSPTNPFTYNRSVGNTFVAASTGAGFGSGQVRPQIPGGAHNHTTSVSGTFTNSGAQTINLGVKYVDLMIATKNGVYGATWASQTTTSVIKGSAVSITWNTPTTTIPVGSTLYYTIQNTGFTGALDTTAMSGSFVTTGATFTQSITIIDNGVWENGGSFMVHIRSDSINGVIMAYSQLTTITETNPTATFTVVPTAITEGTSGTFTFTSTRLKNGEILTYSISNGTTGTEPDFTQSSGTVVVNSNTGTFTMTPKIDLLVEGIISTYDVFTVRLITRSGLILATSNSVSITDVPPTVTFTVTPTTINVYDNGTFTITTSNVPNGTGLTWVIGGGSYNQGTFKNTTGTVYIYNNTGTFYITPDSILNYNLLNTVSAWTFTVAIQNSTGYTLQTSSLVTVNNCTVVFESPITSMNEGQTISYTINTTNIINGTQLQWKIIPLSALAGNFTSITGYTTINNNKGTFSVTTVPDISTTGTKTFDVDVYDFSGTYKLTGIKISTLGYSTYFNGTTNSLSTLTSTSFIPTTLGTEFTFEGFFYITREMTAGPTKIFGGSNIELNINHTVPGQVRLDLPSGVTNIINSGTTVLQSNYWYHIAFTRTIGNLYTLYINGVSVGTGSSTTAITAMTNIGAVGQTYPFQGYMYNVRITNTVVYTGNFVVPREPLATTQTAGTNISAITSGQVTLLTFQNNSVSDNSGRNSLAFAGIPLVTSSAILPFTASAFTANILDVFAGSTYRFVSPPLAVLEGASISLQFESNKNSGTIYWKTNNSTTSDADFTGSVVSGSIILNGSNVIDITSLNPRYLQTFTITTATLDMIDESEETFTVSLWDGVSGTGNRLATSNTISIIDAPKAYYLVNPSMYINEGVTTTYTVNTMNIINGTTLYWDIITGTTSAADFSAVSGSFAITNNIGSFPITTTLDGLLEGDETFTLNVRTTTALTGPVVASQLIIIKDTSVAPTYTFVNPTTVISEGGTNIYTVNITGAAPTTYFWTIATGATATAGDFSASNGSFATTGTTSLNSGIFSVTASQDATTEGPQTFALQVRTGSVTGTVVATTPLITITDTSLNPTYAFVNPITTIYEGEVISYTVNITDVALGTTLFWTTTLNFPTSAADFVSSVVSGSFTKNTGTFSSGTGAFSVSLSKDALSEGSESFVLQVRTGSLTGTVVANSPIITVISTSENPTYTFVIPATSINEGAVTTYSIDATDVLVGSSLYWTIAHGTTAAADFSSTSGSFVLNPRLPYNNSVYFAGNGYLTISTGYGLALGSGDWTIEFWIFMDSTYPQNIICDWRAGGIGGGDPRPVLYVEGQTLIWRAGGVDVLKAYSAVPINAWSHYALVKSGGILTLYGNGNAMPFNNNPAPVYSMTDPVNNYGNDTGIFQIGKAWDAYYWHGSITNFRIVKGTAVYTSNFAVPTTQLKNISGTLLLACQGPTVTTDNSTANNRLPWTIATGGTAPTISDNVINFIPENTTGTISAGTGTFAITTAADYRTEGAETFALQVRTVSATGNVVATSPTITINDTTLFTTGQAIWATYTGTVVNWVAPPGAVRMSAVVIGGGGGGYSDNINNAYSGGGGGALSYANNIPITPGETYRIYVGKTGTAGSRSFGATDTSGTSGEGSYILNPAGSQLLGARPGGGSSGSGGIGGPATAICNATGAVRYAGGSGGQVGVFPYTGAPGSAATYTSNGTYSVPGGTSLLGSAGLTYKLGSGGVNGGVRIMWWTDTTANYRAYPNTNTANM